MSNLFYTISFVHVHYQFRIAFEPIGRQIKCFEYKLTFKKYDYDIFLDVINVLLLITIFRYEISFRLQQM